MLQYLQVLAQIDHRFYDAGATCIHKNTNPACFYEYRYDACFSSLADFQLLSTFCVCEPVFGSTKFNEWFTVKCWKPIAPTPLYAPHKSEWTFEPGRTETTIIGRSVAALLPSAGYMKHSLVCLQLPPNTHYCGKALPR